MRRPHPWHWAAVVAGCLLLAACGGNERAGSGGYLATASDGVAYLQWTRTGNDATGSLTLTALTPRDDGRLDLRTDDSPFSAVISEDSVTVDFDGKTWNGRIDGSAIELSYHADDGTLRTLRFEPASQDEFNAAVATLQETRAVAEEQATRGEAEADAAERIDQAAADVWYRLETVADYPAQFEGPATDARASYESVQDALVRTEDALATTRAAGTYDVCYEADSTAYEADGVDYELDSVRYHRDVVNDTSASMAQEIASLRQAFADFESTSTLLPGYQAEQPPTAREVDDAASAAEAAAARARRTVDALIRKAKQLATTADGYVTQARAECRRRG